MDAQKVLKWMAEEDRTLAYLARKSGVVVDRLVAVLAEQHDEWAGRSPLPHLQRRSRRRHATRRQRPGGRCVNNIDKDDGPYTAGRDVTPQTSRWRGSLTLRRPFNRNQVPACPFPGTSSLV